jgi:hypothetical protein
LTLFALFALKKKEEWEMLIDYPLKNPELLKFLSNQEFQTLGGFGR